MELVTMHCSADTKSLERSNELSPIYCLQTGTWKLPGFNRGHGVFLPQIPETSLFRSLTFRHLVVLKAYLSPPLRITQVKGYNFLCLLWSRGYMSTVSTILHLILRETP